MREINDVRAKIEVERSKIINDREAMSAERLATKSEREQLASDRAKMAEGRGVLEREMKQMRDLALDLENKAAEVITAGVACPVDSYFNLRGQAARFYEYCFERTVFLSRSRR